MKRAALALALAAPLFLAPPAHAAFGFAGFQVTALEHDGTLDEQAGSHPYELLLTVNLNSEQGTPAPGGPYTEGDLRDLTIEEPPGLIENPSVVPTCSQTQFNTPRSSPFEASLSGESCPVQTQIGTVAVHTSYGGGETRTFGVFNLAPPPGYPSEIGFSPFGLPITMTPTIRDAAGEYGLTLNLRSLSQLLDVKGFELRIWGTPWGIVHNTERGNCLNEQDPEDPYAKCSPGRPRGYPPQAYLTLPGTCAAPLTFNASATSWQGDSASATWQSHDEAGNPQALQGCERLGISFLETAIAEPTNTTALTPTGLDFDLELSSDGLTSPSLLAPSQIRKAVLTLPEGMTINPSVGSGLGVCTPAQYAAETASSPPGAGCPNASKIGDVTVHSPLFEGVVKGSLFLAQPYQNPYGSLVALYIVAKSPERGVLVKVPGEVEPSPQDGQLIATFEELPQLPYTLFGVHFREGHRAPLVTPAACGEYFTRTELTPWLGSAPPRLDGSRFNVATGIGGGPCPAGTPPFSPQAQAGTVNGFAGAYSPFYLHLTRTDEEQEITSYSATVPPGLLGKIAGIPFCPDAAIEAAKSESGTEEAEHPSCPPASEIGHTETGYGIGSTLAYAPGKLFLAGPYHGAPLSIVAIDSALVGPFDLGTVVIRSGIDINPRTAQVSIDSAAADPIPHILDGIPLRLRDIRVYISRPEFTLNPTSCEPFSVTSTLTGSAPPFTNPDDATATPTDRFQALYCSELGFAPQLSLRLKGGHKRGDYPVLIVTVAPRPGDANIASAAVTLPPTLFLAQSHIRAICTRPQLAGEACPPASEVGVASAQTPLLEKPLEGPVYLRSSSTVLPGLVAVLHGRGVRILLEGSIDKNHGGIRGAFTGLPDAPVTSFTMKIDGGPKRGLLQNGANLCAAPQHGIARFFAQDNAGEALRPRVRLRCRRAGKRGHHRRKTDNRGGKR